MAYKIIFSKSFKDDVANVLDYLHKEWPQKVTENFIHKLYSDIDFISQSPQIGRPSLKMPNVHKILITKHNALYYRIKNDTIEILSLFDTRQNPAKNPY